MTSPNCMDSIMLRQDGFGSRHARLFYIYVSVLFRTSVLLCLSNKLSQVFCSIFPPHSIVIQIGFLRRDRTMLKDPERTWVFKLSWSRNDCCRDDEKATFYCNRGNPMDGLTPLWRSLQRYWLMLLGSRLLLDNCRKNYLFYKKNKKSYYFILLCIDPVHSKLIRTYRSNSNSMS